MKSVEKELIPTPSEIWKILRETNRLLQKSQQETDRRIQKSKEEMARKIQENDRLLRESKQETDRLLRESKQETDRLLRESKQENDRRKLETDRKIQENDRLLQKSQKKLEKMIEENKVYIQKIDSRWGNQWGRLMEALMKGSLLKLLNQKGIKAIKVVPNYEGQWEDLDREYDLVAINSQEMVVVETKSHLKKGHVDDFLKEMASFKKFCPEFKHLKAYGGVACLRSAKEVRGYAEKEGLFVFRVQGNDNAILANKPQFKPKVFC